MAELVRLTQDYIKNLKPEPKRTVYRDTDAKGLVLTVTPRGHKSFSWVGRAEKKAQRITIGTFPEMAVERARSIARRLLADARDGKPLSPPNKKDRGGISLGEVWDWWYKNYALPKTKRPAKRLKLFESSFDDWRDLKLDEISSSMVDEKHAQIGEARGKTTANDAMDLLQQLFICAQEKRGWKGISPVVGLVRFQKVERDRYLVEDELPRFFEALKKTRSGDARDWLLLCLWTGARKSNVYSMEWKEIEGDAWQIPASKVKQRKPVRIPLPPQAIQIIECRRGLHPRWVFPSKSATGHYCGSYHLWIRLRKIANLEDVRIHDLRRTLGSWQAMQGTSELIIGKSLGHTSSRSTRVYARLQIDPVRASVDAATAAIESAGKKSENSDKTPHIAQQ